jgi:hypothetical protein
MRLELHPDAARNFDAKAGELVAKLIPDPHAGRRTGGGFTPGIVIHDQPEAAEVVSTGYASQLGNEIAKTFRDGDRDLGLFDEGYKDLVRLAEKVQKVKSIRDAASRELLVELIFKWVASKYQGKADGPMTAYVLAECEKQLREAEIWVPVAMLGIQSDIKIGRVTLKTVTKQMLDPWFSAIAGKAAPHSTAAQMESRLDEMRREMQGFAAATVKVFAEPRRALEVAFEEAERAVSLLRFFSPASHIPELVSYCTLRGKEHVEGLKQLTVRGGRIEGYSEQSVDRSSPFWALDGEHIAELEACGLRALGDLLNRDKLTEYQGALLDAVLLYSKVALAKSPTDKLIAALVALESFLLKDGNESIQQNLADRIAFLFKISAKERMEKKRHVIRAYGLRSSFIHHGHQIDIEEMDTLREFLLTAWLSFNVLIEVSEKYETRAQLFDQIEEWKMT